MTATAIDPMLAAIGCLEQLRESIPALADGQVTDRLRAVESLSRVAHSVMLELVAEVEARNLAGQGGFGSTKRLLAAMVGLSQAEARTRVAHAEAVAPRRALTGELLPPRCPATAAGLAAGQIGPQQLRVIAEMAAVPDSISVADRVWAEAQLAQHARHLDPAALGRLGTRVLAYLDPDGPEPAADESAPAASGALRLRDRRHGGVGFEGWLDGEHAPGLRELIERLAAPRPAAEGVADPRGVEQRQADALIELCELARAAEAAPTTAGEPPHLTITLDLNMLIDGIGAAALDYGSVLPAGEARRWACDAKIIPMVLRGDSEPLDVGRAMRTVPSAVRRALIVRDKGCSYPGCGRPPSRCAAHHVRHWVDGGETSVENCCLLCEYHHRVVHSTGWDIVIHPDRAEFIPPAILDPDRSPLRNPLRW